MVKKVYLKPIMSVEESDKMSGRLLNEGDCKQLFTQDVDVYDKVTGSCIAKFRKGVIPGAIVLSAYESLKTAATIHWNRGTAAGKKEIEGKKLASSKPLRKAGFISNTVEALPTPSGIVGYYDRTVRMPYCRLTSFNQKHFSRFKKAYPIIKFVDRKYLELMPLHYAKQRRVADCTSPDFVIKGTVFTTVTVNKNWQTAVHKDKGDFKEGFGNLVALRKGKYTGGHFVVVRWGVGFDLQNGDVLMVDVHQWHGNTPIIKDNSKVVRLSLVMYYREDMKDCGTMAQELERAKKRKKGDPLKGK